MNRLTKTYKDGTYGIANDLPCTETSYTFERLLIDALGEYEDLEEQGRLIRLPCKVNDMVYEITYDCTEGLRYNPFDKYGISYAQKCLKCGTYPCNLRVAVKPILAEDEEWILKNRIDFGTSLFLTQSDAEAKLKELRESEKK